MAVALLKLTAKQLLKRKNNFGNYLRIVPPHGGRKEPYFGISGSGFNTSLPANATLKEEELYKNKNKLIT